MKIIGYLFVGFLILGMVGAAIKMMIIGLFITLGFALILQPRQTLGMLVGLILMGLLGQYPVPMLVIGAGLSMLAVGRSARNDGG